MPDPALGFAGEVLALRPAILAFARRLCRDGTEAEDLAQETIAKAIGAEARFLRGTRLKPWLFTILRNTCNTRYVRSRRDTLPGSEVIEMALASPATQGSNL